MAGSLIVSGARTPIGKLAGSLSGWSAMELGGLAIKAALERAGLKPEDVDYVVMGQVLGAGQGQATARQAAVHAGIPMVTPATTVNKVCLSGLNSIHLADLMIRAGEAAIVVAGGMESMSRAPYLLPGARDGYRFGDQRVVDSMMHDGLFCAFDRVAMGLSADAYGRAAGISRERQDTIAAASHERASTAIKEGRLAEEIVAVSVPQRKGDPIVFDTDEGVRPATTVATLAALRPAFDQEGTVTAGNASQISDGGAAVVVMSPERADELGIAPLGEIIGYGQVAGPDTSLLTQPSRAIREAVAKAGLEISDVDLFEISEAFAVVSAASIDDLGVSDAIVNVNGGAIALGHPIGMSGTRLAISILYELRRRGGGVGAVGLCGGGGQGDAAVLRTVA
jgi:acetyl-CoA C-acetyltransferase